MRATAHFSPALVAVGLAVVTGGALLALEPVRDALGAIFQGDVAALRRQADGLGAGAALLLVALVLVHVVVPFPAELPTAAAGFVFGFWIGLALMLTSWLVSGVLAYQLARSAGRPVVERFVSAERIARAEAFLARGGVRTLLAARLIPIVPFSLFSYACGLARVPLGRYTWTTLAGFTPLTVLTVLLGARLQEPDLTDPVLLGVLGGLLVLLFASPVLARRVRRSSQSES